MIISMRREALRRLLDEPEYGLVEVEREGGLWERVADFMALFPGVRMVWRVEFIKVPRRVFLALLRGRA
jgi:hypothetical protein